MPESHPPTCGESRSWIKKCFAMQFLPVSQVFQSIPFSPLFPHSSPPVSPERHVGEIKVCSVAAKVLSVWQHNNVVTSSFPAVASWPCCMLFTLRTPQRRCCFIFYSFFCTFILLLWCRVKLYSTVCTRSWQFCIVSYLQSIFKKCQRFQLCSRSKNTHMHLIKGKMCIKILSISIY